MSSRIQSLAERGRRVSRQGQRLLGVQSRLIEDKLGLLANLEQARACLEGRERVSGVLAEAQSSLQSQSKDLFEDLLTELVREVMPGVRGRVVLETGVRADRPWVEVSMEVPASGGGTRLERVDRDKGGSIQNLVSIGLRFIVLARTANRRFLVLDEPDCWLRGDYVAALANALGHLARRVGVQVLYISHHDAEAFAPYARLVRLRRSGGRIEACVREDGVPGQGAPSTPEALGEKAWPEEGSIRHVRLMNFKGHENTLIELSPHMTVVCGDNDVGKSSIVHALEAINSNAGSASLVRDGARKAAVEIGLEDGRSLVWEYRRTGSRKTSYSLAGPGAEPLAHSDAGQGVPSWVEEHLCMPAVDGLSVNFHGQSQPLFFIGASVSAYRRAEILNMGREGEAVGAMIAEHNRRITQARARLREDGKRLEEIKRALEAIRPAAQLTETLCGDEDAVAAMIDEARTCARMGQTIAQMEAALARTAAVSGASQVRVPTAPEEIQDLHALVRKASEIGSLEGRVRALARISAVEPPQPPTVEDTARIAAAGRALNHAQQRLERFDGLERLLLPEPPAGGRGEHGARIVDAMDKESARLSEAAADEAKRVGELERVDAEIDDLLGGNGGFCPFCRSLVRGPWGGSDIQALHRNSGCGGVQ